MKPVSETEAGGSPRAPGEGRTETGLDREAVVHDAGNLGDVVEHLDAQDRALSKEEMPHGEREDPGPGKDRSAPVPISARDSAPCRWRQVFGARSRNRRNTS